MLPVSITFIDGLITLQQLHTSLQTKLPENNTNGN